MIVRYCPICVGAPFTRNMLLEVCPVCGTHLETELIQDDSALWGRAEIGSAFFETDPFDPVDADDPFCGADPFSANADDDTAFEWGVDSSEPSIADPERDQGRLPNTYNFDTEDDQAIRPARDTIPVRGHSKQHTLTNNGRAINSMPKVRDGAGNSNVVVGKVADYSNSSLEPGEYHRNIVQKIVGAIVYGQRTDDIIHRFIVRTGDDDPLGGGYHDVFVNVHGIIAGGMQISNNQKVEVHGRYHDGVLLARKMYILNGVGKVPVNFQLATGGLALFGGLALLVVFFFIGGLGNPGSMLGGIGVLLSEWLLMLVISAFIWFFLLSKLGFAGQLIAYKSGKASLVGILVLSILLTLVFNNTFGLGNAAGTAVNSMLDYVIALSGPVITIAIMLYGIYKMIKL